ncbi:MAG: DUF1330 domain-containing protein [Pseudomonadota bacterium]|nr:DUF1330 domain-containing protein [Pseudomonadota bacterium]
MSVLLVSTLRIKDPAKLAEYRKAVGPMIRARGAELVCKSDHKVADLAGNLNADSVVIFRFESMDALRGWYDSPAYQELVALRDEGSEGEFAVFEE